MKLYRSAFSKIKGAERGSSVALGCFDGVHIGHSKIISSAVGFAKENKLLSVVWSFEAPPKSILENNREGGAMLIAPFCEKRRLISSLGVDCLVSVSFDEKISSFSPRDFFEKILLDKLNARHIVCGYNYKFGKGGCGDVELLRALCSERGLSLTVIDEIRYNGKAVSSSAIRYLLSAGDIDLANSMLGRNYYIRARVSDGQHLGASLGFPTVNQELSSPEPLRRGVYFSKIKLGKKVYYGVTNVGVRPTVEKSFPICETHILDFFGSLYGRIITVELISFIRDERKFDTLDALQEQIASDVSVARELARRANENK